MKKLIVGFSTLALAVASAANGYSVKLYEPSIVGGAEIKPGEYKMEVRDGHLVFKDGKKTVETEVKVESANEKFKSTTVKYQKDGDKLRLTEIRLGGTNTTLVVGGTAAGN